MQFLSETFLQLIDNSLSSFIITSSETVLKIFSETRDLLSWDKKEKKKKT